MPSAPASFTVKFDLTGTPKLVLTDNGAWGVGEAVNAQGFFEITLPDGVTRAVNFASPDIEWDGSVLSPFEYTLRLNAQGNLQCGSYTIRYYTDHPSYTVNSLTRSFTVQYSEKTLDVDKDFDVFTPSLFYRDETDYSQTGYTITSNAIAWSSVITSVGTVLGTASDFDLMYGGQYYAGIYTTSMQRDLLYTSIANSWLTIAERYNYSSTDTIYAPPSTQQMLICLNALWTQMQAAACSCKLYETLKDKFLFASSLYTLIFGKLQALDYDGLAELIIKFQSIAGCTGGSGLGTPLDPYNPIPGGSSATEPLDFIVNATDSPILAGQSTIVLPQFIGYNLEFHRGGQPQYTTNPGDGTTYYFWNKVTGVFSIFGPAQLNEPFRIVPVSAISVDSVVASNQKQPKTYKVGVTAGAPTAGQTTWQVNDFANAYILLFLNGRPVSTIVHGTEPYITKALDSDTLTISNYEWVNDDELIYMLIAP
jgi:hypothetical protein